MTEEDQNELDELENEHNYRMEHNLGGLDKNAGERARFLIQKLKYEKEGR